MKRSEMLEIMWNFIGKVECDYDYYMDKEDTDKLLKCIEKHMKPKSYRYEDGDIGSCFKEGWEPENEKK